MTNCYIVFYPEGLGTLDVEKVFLTKESAELYKKQREVSMFRENIENHPNHFTMPLRHRYTNIMQYIKPFLIIYKMQDDEPELRFWHKVLRDNDDIVYSIMQVFKQEVLVIREAELEAV